MSPASSDPPTSDDTGDDAGSSHHIDLPTDAPLISAMDRQRGSLIQKEKSELDDQDWASKMPSAPGLNEDTFANADSKIGIGGGDDLSTSGGFGSSSDSGDSLSSLSLQGPPAVTDGGLGVQAPESLPADLIPPPVEPAAPSPVTPL